MLLNKFCPLDELSRFWLLRLLRPLSDLLSLSKGFLSSILLKGSEFLHSLYGQLVQVFVEENEDVPNLPK